MLYTAAFDVVKENSFYGFGTLTMDNGAAAGTAVVLTLGSIVDGEATTFWVWDDAEVECIDHSPYAQNRFEHFAGNTWSEAIDAALKAGATAAGWGGNVPACTFNTANGTYSFNASGSNTSLAWSTTNGRALFGFSGDSSSAASHTGTLTPLFVINPTLQAVSEPTLSYEPSGIGNHVTSDNGAGFGLARRVSPLYRDWRQEYETKAKTMRLEAASTHPWTFQHLFEHCRGRFPFLVADGGFNDTESDPAVFMFREDGIAFVPERATPGNDTQLHVPFRCVVQGNLSTVVPE